jgi:5-methylcytosine-specific restriction endonuclease McrA
MARTIAELRSAVRDRDGDDCSVCHLLIDFAKPPGTPAGPTLEHVTPVAAGGARRDLQNLSLSHGRCNHEKGALHDGVDYATSPLGRHRRHPADSAPRRRVSAPSHFESFSAARS